MRNMINFESYTKEELLKILDMAKTIKADQAKYAHLLEGKKLYLLFEKTSTRTYLSFATGITELGGSYYYQLYKDSNFVLGDTTSELQYVGRNVDIIMGRLIDNEMVKLFDKKTTIPFINGCDSTYHPCQILADALTIIEHFGSLDVKFLYIGAKNNVFNSLVEFFTKMKIGKLYGFTPLDNKTNVPGDFYEKAKATGFYEELDTSMSKEELNKIVRDMDVLYTDTWVDMEFFNNPAYAKKKEETVSKMLPYQINDELMEGSKAKVMHDMPMHIGYEISQSVVDKNMDFILDEAENRRHAEKAVMAFLLGAEV